MKVESKNNYSIKKQRSLGALCNVAFVFGISLFGHTAIYY